MVPVETANVNHTTRENSFRTVYFRQGRFFVISITERTSHGLIFTRYYTSGRFDVKEDLQWVNRPVEAAHSAGESCGDALSRAVRSVAATELPEGCCQAVTTEEESSDEEADTAHADSNGMTLQEGDEPPVNQQPCRQRSVLQVPAACRQSRCLTSPTTPVTPPPCTCQQRRRGNSVKAHCQQLSLKLKTSLKKALHFIAKFIFSLTWRPQVASRGSLEGARPGTSEDPVPPGVHQGHFFSTRMTKPSTAPGPHPVAVNITAVGWPWGLDMLSTQVSV